ncbi:gamma carbonic anhydrase family protein [Heliomicrobium undosum]|uniref:gamma carbonic anhydrase family protein n=1 Tax=Heliomicrobium undosum TaxID=121734 RepID=UPI001478DDB1|nr:acyltransferase [Heliomicrobium undosum]
MLIRHRDHEPIVNPTAYVSPTSTLVGKVLVGPHGRILFGAIVTAETSMVEIGEYAIISENAVLRGNRSADTDQPVLIGDHVFIGPHATLLGCAVAPCSYIATGATVLQGAKIGSGAVIAVGALVHANTVIPDGYFVPPYAVAIGDPVQLYSPNQKEEMAEAIRRLGFARTAFGIEGPFHDRKALYKSATEIRSQEYASHFQDIILDPVD